LPATDLFREVGLGFLQKIALPYGYSPVIRLAGFVWQNLSANSLTPGVSNPGFPQKACFTAIMLVCCCLKKS
jgi:hypothetical protein